MKRQGAGPEPLANDHESDSAPNVSRSPAGGIQRIHYAGKRYGALYAVAVPELLHFAYTAVNRDVTIMPFSLQA